MTDPSERMTVVPCEELIEDMTYEIWAQFPSHGSVA
jgi:hypothetical protein